MSQFRTSLRFRVLPPGTWPPSGVVGAFLQADNWNDYGYVTMFNLSIEIPPLERIDIGQVKFGRFGMPQQGQPDIPPEFTSLDVQFFSLGQDADYYENLRNLGDELRITVLSALRDIAFDREIFRQAILEDVTGTSLLRHVNKTTVERQFHRIARGGDTATPFHFSYHTPSEPNFEEASISLPFSVSPDSYPPTNIHAIIGGNGVGKTHLLRRLGQAVADDSLDPTLWGRIENLSTDTDSLFANLISVSFSAFDTLPQLESRSVYHAYVSLKSVEEATPRRGSTRNTNLARHFETIVSGLTGERDRRWQRALTILETDPIFHEVSVYNSIRQRPSGTTVTAASLFDSLSSGHKIVLLAITRLVDLVTERTLVLIDEPETHLHPPLLSAFIRALSELLIDRNGVAIVATHSPVVLQEMPKSCVWKLRRSGTAIAAERPAIETFGENVGILTREIFSLEVTRSGFHRMLQEAVEDGLSFAQVVDLFSGQLGSEALGLARVLIAERDERNIRPF